MSSLAKKRIVITRPKNTAVEFASAMADKGAQAVIFPVIEISPVLDTTFLDRAISNLDCYDWLVLTSANAVEALWQRMDALTVNHLPDLLSVAAVGPKTAASLEKRGVQPGFEPQKFIAEAIVPGLGDLHDRWVLLPSADLARDTLPQAVLRAGGIAHVITAYHTVPASPDPMGMHALREGVDVITFTSPSTVDNFIALTQNAGLDPHHLPGKPLFACIGPVTLTSAEEHALGETIVATEHTQDGLITALEDYYR